jgi:hypothetical protein
MDSTVALSPEGGCSAGRLIILRCLVNQTVASTQAIHPDPRQGRRPASPFRPTSRKIFGRPAPTRIGIGCAAAGPNKTPRSAILFSEAPIARNGYTCAWHRMTKLAESDAMTQLAADVKTAG